LKMSCGEILNNFKVPIANCVCFFPDLITNIYINFHDTQYQ
jgi:hypothetical protein